MNKVAVLYICTGKYDVFWKDFYISYEKYFLPDCEKHYYVFTGCGRNLHGKENLRIHKFYQESLGWPDNTLMRFHMFLRQKAELEKYDYIFFMNANCQALDTITEEEFLPKKKDIIVVQHPGYYNKTNKQFDAGRVVQLAFPGGDIVRGLAAADGKAGGDDAVEPQRGDGIADGLDLLLRDTDLVDRELLHMQLRAAGREKILQQVRQDLPRDEKIAAPSET